MLEQRWRKLRRFAAGVLIASIFGGSVALAEDPALTALMARVDALEKRNQELEKRLQLTSPVPGSLGADGNLDSRSVETIVGDILQKKEEEKKAQQAADAEAKIAEGSKVGSILGMSAEWTPGGVFFSTPNEDFVFHVGGRLDFDQVWWKEPPFLQGSAPGTSGAGASSSFAGTPAISAAALGARQFAAPIPVPAKGLPAAIPLTTNVGTTGVGVLEDGSFMRRARFQAGGSAYEVMEWNVEIDFQNINTIFMDNTYVGVRDLPWLGTVRAGNLKVPQGLESYSSDRYIPTMERSGLFDAFFNQYALGLYASNSILDQRITWHYMFSRMENAIQNVAADFGDGDYAHTVRVTGLPLYLEDGRYLLHLGMSYQYKVDPLDTTTSGASGSGAGLPGTPLSPGAPPLFPQNVRVVTFRDRPGLRDSVGTGALSLGDSGRFIDTGDIIAPGVNTTSGELMAYAGPFWLQCEGTWANVPNAIYPPGTIVTVPPGLEPGSKGGIPNAGGQSVPGAYQRGTLNYWGYYLMASYFLTGENRSYDRRFGAYDRVIPNENFFLVRGEDGRPQFGWGAWQLVYRWSYTDLDSKGADGGRLGEHTVGLNWHLNPNAKIMLNYVIDQRNFNQLIPTFAPTGSTLTYSNVRQGQTEGLGLRFHLDF